jgi:acetaldehyde dehydrogenase
MECAILGTGKIGIDLYFKLKKKKFSKISIFNLNPKSPGAKYCKRKKFKYYSTGIDGILKKNKYKIIFDTTNTNSNIEHSRKIINKNIIMINLTPSGIGKFHVPYIDENKKNNCKFFNLITCGGQSSIPIIYEISKYIKDIKYVEIVSAISADSAGLATRANINEYLDVTSIAVKKYTKIRKVKIILNINPSIPPVHMSNSIYFEIKNKLNKSKILEVKKIINKVNKKMILFTKGYNAKFISKLNDSSFKVTLSVSGDGDYLPKYSGNLDIITNMAANIASKFYKKGIVVEKNSD